MPSSMKKRSRWDQKDPPPPGEEGNDLRWPEWKSASNSTTEARNSLDVQAPLDYSTDGRNRSSSRQRNCDHSPNSREKGIDFVEQQPQAMMPPHWPIYSNFPSYPSSSRGSAIPFPPPRWQHPNEYFMNNSSYNMKFWTQDRPPSNQFPHSNHYDKKDKKGYNSYINSRNQKEHHPFFNDYAKRYPNTKSNFDKATSKENEFQPDTLIIQKNKYRMDNVKDFRSHNHFNHSTKHWGTSAATVSKDFNNRYNRKKNCSALKPQKGDRNTNKEKNMQANKSAAEKANSKAFDLAASKLRQVYLATRNGKGRDCLKLTKNKICKTPTTSSIHHKKGSPWESISSRVASGGKMTEMNCTSIAQRKLGDSNNYSSTNTDSESDDSDNYIDECTTSYRNISRNVSISMRKRRCSESCLTALKVKPILNLKRPRSVSTSLLEINASKRVNAKDTPSSIIDKVKGILTGKLLKVAKNELANNSHPNKKLQLLLETLNNFNGCYSAEKLLTERIMFTESSNVCREGIHQSIDMNIFPDDLFQQVKEILEMEALGKGSGDLDEISLSIADLITGTIEKSQCSASHQSNHSEHLESEIEILTPPPKTPATMITLADSDTDFLPSLSSSESPTKDLLNTSSISPAMSYMSLSPSPQKCKIQTPPPFTQTFPLGSQPPPIKRSISSTACLLPIIPTLMESTDVEDGGSHLEDSPPDKENLDQGGKAPTPQLQGDNLCDINVSSPLVKIKEERPSPISECRLCMHSARSPHTPQCGFIYGIASSPVPLISGPPPPLTNSAQRPVPRLPTDLSRIFKHEKSEGATFVSLENIDRPSSEERPKNPAPPDTASSEPPSPLPIPPPESVSSLHPPPARQIVFSDDGFIEPPRPPPPPPLEHSPPIKFERRTPNSSFACYCLRSDCDRSEHSDFHRAEQRRASHGPIREARGAHLYKMEAPFLPNARPRTPQNMLNLFAIPAARPRCMISNTGGPSTAPNLRLQTHEPRVLVNTAVQTERPNLPHLLDKSTNVDTYGFVSNSTSICDRPMTANSSTRSKVFSRVDNLLSEVKVLSDEQQLRSNSSFRPILDQCEDQAFNLLSQLEQDEKEIYNQKAKLIAALRDMSNLRKNAPMNCINSQEESVDKAVNTNHVTSSPVDVINRTFLKTEAYENSSVVSSSQEVEPQPDHPYTMHDEQPPEVERCTSTSELDTININEDENSENFESFIKEEHTAQDFESRPVCTQPPEEGNESITESTAEYQSLPLSASDNDQMSNLQIEQNDTSSKIVGDDIIIMGDLSHRKMVLFSPLSPKTRNSSGSEHGYSLRSRGPPSDSYDYNSDSNQVPKEGSDNGIVGGCSPPKRRLQDGSTNDNKADISNVDSDVIVESCFKKKRKRKTKKLASAKRKRKKILDFENLINLAHNQNHFDLQKCDAPQQNVSLVMPSPIESPILTLKIGGNFIFAGCSDSCVRVYDLLTGKLCQVYPHHSSGVTSLLILGEPNYGSLSLSRFTLVTGSEDRHLRIFDGKTANMTMKINASEPITCLEHRWKYIFIGTEGGCGIKWNLKDKKLGEKIQFCSKMITCLVPHTEGGRKVLVVAAKTSPLMVRDAMTGLFLRSLECVPLNVYSAVFEGNLLYVGGSANQIYVYDFCSGTVKTQINSFSGISSLLLHSNNIIATCYDGFVRIINITGNLLTHTLPVESSQKMFTCSFLYKNQIILGNKYGEVVACKLPSD